MKQWKRWLAWLAIEETAEPLALFRIGCGLCVMAMLTTVLLSGLALPLWGEAAAGGVQAAPRPHWLGDLLGAPSASGVHRVIALAFCGAIATTLGLFGRMAPFVTLQAFLALTRSNFAASGGQDLLVANALWLLVLSGGTATWSLDCRLRTLRWSSQRLVSAWPRKLIVFQLVLMYFSSGLHKLSSTWTPIGDFSALYYVLLQPSWQRAEMSWLGSLYPLTQVSTALVWLFEIGSPLLLLALYYRGAKRGGRLRSAFDRWDLRVPFAILGASMHVGIFLLMEVGSFSWITLCFYLCLWKPEELRAFFRRSGGS